MMLLKLESVLETKEISCKFKERKDRDFLSWLIEIMLKSCCMVIYNIINVWKEEGKIKESIQAII